jgi:hypothetical protein
MKIQVIKINNTDYVLCLYDKDDSRKFELSEKYPQRLETDSYCYRYWKSDIDTIKGIYSKEFLELLRLFTLLPLLNYIFIENQTLTLKLPFPL